MNARWAMWWAWRSTCPSSMRAAGSRPGRAPGAASGWRRPARSRASSAARCPPAPKRLGLRVAAARSFAAVQVPRPVDLVRRAEVSYREGERPIFDLIDALRTAREVTLRELALRRRAKQAEIQLWSTRGYR